MFEWALKIILFIELWLLKIMHNCCLKSHFVPTNAISYLFVQEMDTVKLTANFGKLCTVPLDKILVHNVALQFFMGK